MRISAKDLKDRCREIWPDAFYITQGEYYTVPKIKEVEAFINSNAVDNLPFIKGILECELYALFLLCDVKKMCIEKNQYHWSFGKGFGLMWDLEVEHHAANIFLAQNNLGEIIVYCAEPQTDFIWEADSQRDLILLVDFC